MRILTIEIDEKTYYKCPLDGANLWVKHKNGFEFILNNCKHFVWKSIANGCYPLKEYKCDGVDEIIKKGIKHVDYGVIHFVLIPTDKVLNELTKIF